MRLIAIACTGILLASSAAWAGSEHAAVKGGHCPAIHTGFSNEHVLATGGPVGKRPFQEYLELHAAAAEQSSRYFLMPWSSLQTRTN